MAEEARHVVEDVPGLDELAEALLTLRTPEEAKRFQEAAWQVHQETNGTISPAPKQ